MQNEITQESKNSVLIIWACTALFGFIPSLIFYLTKKDDEYIQDQAKEALNWSITTTIAYIVGLLISFIPVVGRLAFIAIVVVHIAFCVMGAMGASEGKKFRLPFALRLIK